MQDVPIFIIFIKFPSLDKFILGAQVQVPEFAGRPVLGTVRLGKDRRCTFTPVNRDFSRAGSVVALSVVYFNLVVCFCVVEQKLKVAGELLNVIILLHLQLLLNLHHVNRLRHHVVIIWLVPARDPRLSPSSSPTPTETFTLTFSWAL